MSLLIADRLSTGPAGAGRADISFHLDAGEILALVGPGASEIVDIVGGQRRPDRGRLRFGPSDAPYDIARAAPRALARLGIGRTFQPPAVFASMTVRENLQTASLAANDQLARLWRPARRYHRSRADLLLHRLGLLDHANRPAAVLAPHLLGRLDLALALARRPRLLLLDAPTAALPDHEASVRRALFRDLATDGIALLWAEPDIDSVLGTADRILVLGPNADADAETDPETETDPT